MLELSGKKNILLQKNTKKSKKKFFSGNVFDSQEVETKGVFVLILAEYLCTDQVELSQRWPAHTRCMLINRVKR